MAVDTDMDAKVTSEGSEQLKTARKAHQLSIEDVAKRLNLPTARIREIEEAAFDDSVSMAFYRGYIRSYSNLLNLNPTEVLKGFDLKVESNLEIASPQRIRTFGHRRRKEVNTGSKIFKWVSLLIIIGLLVGVGWGLKEKFAKSDNNPESQSIETSISPQSFLDDESEVAEDSSSEPEEEATEPLSNRTTLDQIKNKNDNASIKTEERSTPENDNVQSEVAAQDIASDATEMKNSEMDPVNKDELIFTFVGKCWVVVKDATGERLAYGNKYSSQIMRISGEPPFNIVLGNPSVVRLQYNQKRIDLSNYPAGQIARFTVDN